MDFVLKSIFSLLLKSFLFTWYFVDGFQLACPRGTKISFLGIYEEISNMTSKEYHHCIFCIPFEEKNFKGECVQVCWEEPSPILGRDEKKFNFSKVKLPEQCSGKKISFVNLNRTNRENPFNKYISSSEKTTVKTGAICSKGTNYERVQSRTIKINDSHLLLKASTCLICKVTDQNADISFCGLKTISEINYLSEKPFKILDSNPLYVSNEKNDSICGIYGINEKLPRLTNNETILCKDTPASGEGKHLTILITISAIVLSTLAIIAGIQAIQLHKIDKKFDQTQANVVEEYSNNPYYSRDDN